MASGNHIRAAVKGAGPEGSAPRVTRLNTADWTKATGKARKAARKLAGKAGHHGGSRGQSGAGQSVTEGLRCMAEGDHREDRLQVRRLRRRPCRGDHDVLWSYR